MRNHWVTNYYGRHTLANDSTIFNRLAKVRRKGFTLVELLTVTAIIAVLAGLLFAVARAVKIQAGHSSCQERLHNLGLAIVLYANDHEGWVPPATTAETFYRNHPDLVSAADLAASPGVLKHALDPYVKNSEVWFCPVDPQRGKNVLWLGQRHLLTSYHFLARSSVSMEWPPKMLLGRDRLSNAPAGAEDIPLLVDAVGLPRFDSDPQFSENDTGFAAQSNHPDNYANGIRHDLSLLRKPARWWMGSDQ